jgi:plastocyanin
LFSLIGKRKQQLSIDDSGFSPTKIKLEAGDAVIWTNNGRKPHTVTSGRGLRDPNMGKLFDSDAGKKGKLAIKGNVFLNTFEHDGKYNYFCRLHQTESGIIIVRKI